MADHVALQSVNIGKHLPTYSTVLTKSKLGLYSFEHASRASLLLLTTGFWSERPGREEREGEEWLRGFDKDMKEEGQV